jgi:hypothetical protein
MTTAPEKGADADDPTGRTLFGWQDRPAGHLCGRGCVRVSSSNADDYRFSAPCFERDSWWFAPIGRGGTHEDTRSRDPDAHRSAATAREEARPPGTAEGRRPGRQDRRKPGVVLQSTGVDAACCGAAGCRRTEWLVSVSMAGKKRVLCSQCAVTFVRRETR